MFALTTETIKGPVPLQTRLKARNRNCGVTCSNRNCGEKQMDVAKLHGSDDKKDDEIMLPGFRFHPTDEELVGFYLRRKVEKKPLRIELIKQIDVYKYDPWDLPKGSSVGEKEWYFFCIRGRKYRNSIRPNRVTGSGFWKATGIDKPIYNVREPHECIGLKKSLVYYRGSAGKGTKTDWIMHEFRLPPNAKANSNPQANAGNDVHEALPRFLVLYDKNTNYRERQMDLAKLHSSDDKKEDEVLLPGFIFQPSDEELVEFYLGLGVDLAVEELVGSYLEPKKMEKKHPWDLPRFAVDENDFKDGSLKRFRGVISLKSSDNLVLKMDKMAATSESEVLKGVIECTGGRDEIPVPLVSGRVLKEAVDFCEAQNDFNEILKTIKDRHEGWIKGFVETNHEILFDLNQAADFLNIPSLLDLTSKAAEDMMKKDLGEVDENLGTTPSPWAFA